MALLFSSIQLLDFLSCDKSTLKLFLPASIKAGDFAGQRNLLSSPTLPQKRLDTLLNPHRLNLELEIKIIPLAIEILL
jgi:hypothetical protein